MVRDAGFEKSQCQTARIQTTGRGPYRSLHTHALANRHPPGRANPGREAFCPGFALCPCHPQHLGSHRGTYPDPAIPLCSRRLLPAHGGQGQGHAAFHRCSGSLRHAPVLPARRIERGAMRPDDPDYRRIAERIRRQVALHSRLENKTPLNRVARHIVGRRGSRTGIHPINQRQQTKIQSNTKQEKARLQHGIQKEHHHHRRCRVHRIARSPAVCQQVPRLPHHQRGQIDLCR